MKVLDSGHRYSLASLDGDFSQVLQFVKRNDPPEKYPGNANAYPGTTCQEVLRALLERVRYLRGQIPCVEDDLIISSLQNALFLFELRANRAKGRSIVAGTLEQFELYPICAVCGHTQCCETCATPA